MRLSAQESNSLTRNGLNEETMDGDGGIEEAAKSSSHFTYSPSTPDTTNVVADGTCEAQPC